MGLTLNVTPEQHPLALLEKNRELNEAKGALANIEILTFLTAVTNSLLKS